MWRSYKNHYDSLEQWLAMSLASIENAAIYYDIEMIVAEKEDACSLLDGLQNRESKLQELIKLKQKIKSSVRDKRDNLSIESDAGHLREVIYLFSNLMQDI